MLPYFFKPLAFPFAAALLLPACQGVSGIVTARSEPGSGVSITEVRSYGLEIRNLPGYRGMTLGNRTTTYLQPLAKGAPQPETNSAWGYASMPGVSPVFTSSVTHGLDLAWEPAFRGLSLGVVSLSCGLLNLDQSAILHVDTTSPDPLGKYIYQPQP